MSTHINFDPAIWSEATPEDLARVIKELSEPLPPTKALPEVENAYKGPPEGSDDNLDLLLDQD